MKAPVVPRLQPPNRGDRSGEYLAVRPKPAAEDLPVSWTLNPDAVCDTVHLAPRTAPAPGGRTGTGTVHLVDGEVAWVTADLELMSFTDRLIDAGLVSSAELDLVYALCRVENLSVCSALMRLALVDPPQLREMVREHLRENIRSLMEQGEIEASWTQSHLAFDENLTVGLGELLPPADRRSFRALLVDAGGAPARAHDDARIPLRRTAAVDTVHGQKMMTTLDFSTSGARLRSTSLLPIASRVLVRICIAGEELELPGRVVRFDRGTGKELPAIVVLWTELPEDTDAALSRVWSALY